LKKKFFHLKNEFKDKSCELRALKNDLYQNEKKYNNIDIGALHKQLQLLKT